MEAEKETKQFKRNDVPDSTWIHIKVDPCAESADYTVVASAVAKGESFTFVSGPYTAKDKEELSWALDKVSTDLRAILVDKL